MLIPEPSKSNTRYLSLSLYISSIVSSSLGFSVMEIASAHSLASRCSFISSSYSCSCTSSVAAPVFQFKLLPSVAPRSSIYSKSSFGPLPGARVSGIRQRSALGNSRSSSSEAVEVTSTGVAESWLLQPVGDGDTRHIGFKVEMPGAFEIASEEVTVGRLPEKADMVIPVATVSGLHARLQRKGGDLLVTDLDSTNGTFINEKRLSPGVAAAASPGSRITFGDTHLAIFLVSKIEIPETTESSEGESSDQNAESES
ncbi:hypothetical protein SAY87_016576 [Trapa incisa]|uniref:FHA domain-containing protein n=1 Tax=Trapa incisa TaxID=236973 RepID=A0AAN7QY67_9MYRT|nr:hypothetical protein SAY87_016576 [Trapa incisa]